MNPFEITIVPGVLEQMVDKYIDKRFESMLDGRTWSLDQFRKECCGGKARAWVKLFIFDSFADEIVVNGDKGWLVPSQGKGTKNIIFASSAKAWMEENRYRIDWGAKLP